MDLRMRFCVDTSAYSAFKRGHPGILSSLQRAEEIVLNTVVLAELLAGFRNGDRFERNLAELDRFLSSPRVRTESLDRETAFRYSEIIDFLRQRGTPIPTNDVWIAASAMEHGLRILTTDPHFERVPQVSTALFPP